jgi:hypothetical protein
MCITTKIAALEAKLVSLKNLQAQFSPVKSAIATLLQDYAAEAPEELSDLWEEILAIGGQYDLVMRPIDISDLRESVEELQELEAVQAENEKLKAEVQKEKHNYQTMVAICKALNQQVEDFERLLSLAKLEIQDLKSDKQQCQTELEFQLTERENACNTIETELEEVRSQFEKYQATYNPAPSPQLTPEESAKVAARLTDCAEELQRQRKPGGQEEEEEEVTGFLQISDTFSGTPSEYANTIPALTLWQPWATWIAQGDKKIETRSWSTSYRGRLAIHAAKRPIDWKYELDLPKANEWPLGKVVAIADLIDCIEMTPEFIAAQSQQEQQLGLWQPGRFAWVLDNIQSLDPPIPATGGQKLWKWQWDGAVNAEEEEVLTGAAYDAAVEQELALDDDCDLNTLEGVFKSKGFFQPYPNVPPDWDTSDLYETYRGWEVFYSCPNGGVVAIALNNLEFSQLWDACTENLREEIDPTFPESLTDYDEIIAWTRAVIDRVENLEAPGQMALPLLLESTPTQGEEQMTKLQKLLRIKDHYVFEDLHVGVKIQSVVAAADDTVDFASEEVLFEVSNFTTEKREYYQDAQRLLHSYKNDLSRAALDYAKEFLEDLKRDANTQVKIAQWNADKVEKSGEPADLELEQESKFEAMGYQVQVYPQLPMGVKFQFLDLEGTVKFTKFLIMPEIADRTWKTCAYDLIQNWRDKEAAEREQIENPHKKPEDDFVQLEKLSNTVGYLKRVDTGEILSGYVAFANTDENGQKTSTFAKARAAKWAEYFRTNHEATEKEAKNLKWTCSDPREPKRLKSNNPKQLFKWELKFIGVDLRYLQRLNEFDFSSNPPKQAVKPIAKSPAPISSPDYEVIVNNFRAAIGNLEEMQAQFEEEVKTFGSEGRTVISLINGGNAIESYRLLDFSFVPSQDFDEEKPQYFVLHRPTQIAFNVSLILLKNSESGWLSSIHPYYKGLNTKEACAVDAVRRSLNLKR